MYILADTHVCVHVEYACSHSMKMRGTAYAHIFGNAQCTVLPTVLWYTHYYEKNQP